MKKQKMNTIKWVANLTIYTLSAAICFYMGSCSTKHINNGNIRKHDLVIQTDSSYNIKQYIKKDSLGVVEIVGQFLNGKKDGLWRYFNHGLLARIEIRKDDMLIGVYYPEGKSTNESFKINMPDGSQKQSYYADRKQVKEEYRFDSIQITDDYYYFGNDTTVINRQFHRGPTYSIISDNKRTYILLVPLGDTTVLRIDLNAGKFYSLPSRP